MSARSAIFTGVFVLGAVQAFGQAARPSFDVTSVKPFVPPKITPQVLRALSRGESPEIYVSPGCIAGKRFYTRTMIQPLVLWAYDVKHYQLPNMPARGRDEAWEIEGRTSETGVSDEKCRLMVQALLEDRFKLVVHREQRDVPVQELIVAKGGPKLRAATGEPGTGAGMNGHLWQSQANDKELANGWTMRRLAEMLDIRAAIEHWDPIVDRTGLKGVYQFNLEFNMTPEFGNPENRPELPAALQQQLGLALQRRKEAMDIIVIDHLEKPSPN
jgi:uncharacterized protein (TIGR03435 family)